MLYRDTKHEVIVTSESQIKDVDYFQIILNNNSSSISCKGFSDTDG